MWINKNIEKHSCYAWYMNYSAWYMNYSTYIITPWGLITHYFTIFVFLFCFNSVTRIELKILQTLDQDHFAYVC